MNLRFTRKHNLYLVVGAALILISLGFERQQLTADPIGPKHGVSEKSDPQSGAKQATPSPVVSDQYLIGPEDVLQISVWHEPEISGQVSVRPDGKISMPLIGDLAVSGVTPSKLQITLREKLRAFISNPEVAVSIQQVKSRNFNVLGEVQHPGSFPLVHAVSVLDAIGMAGGFRDFAKVTKIYVLRRMPDGGTTQLPFNYKQAVKGRTDQNVNLMPEDTVVVP